MISAEYCGSQVRPEYFEMLEKNLEESIQFGNNKKNKLVGNRSDLGTMNVLSTDGDLGAFFLSLKFALANLKAPFSRCEITLWTSSSLARPILTVGPA